MSMTTAAANALPSAKWDVRKLARTAGRVFLQLALCYLVLIAVHAWLGRWTPGYLHGRDLWHFMLPRMVVPMVMLGVFASVARLVPAAVMLAATLLFAGTISAIKREATGEPFQVSDLFLASQSLHLFSYVTWDRWLMGAAIIPAAGLFVWQRRLRWWSAPVALVFAGLLSTYRIEAVSDWLYYNSWRIGVENLTFNQAESERMNGLATHLYFSTAGLRLKTYTEAEVAKALAALDAPQGSVAAGPGPMPDLYVVLGEAWWRDPSDKDSPLDILKAAGFSETWAVSPVYGGHTPNAEFEVLTAIPMKSFRAGIIPYQHYGQYVTGAARTLPRMLAERGFATTAYHNYTRRFWLRDQIYPRLGFDRFISMEEMTLVIQANEWPTDEGLFQAVLKHGDEPGPQFHFIVTVETHGSYGIHGTKLKGRDGADDYEARLASAARSLANFEKALRKKGRPYAIVLFGDHLPSLRLHQWNYGMKSETDPRLHRVPVLIASNTRIAQTLASKIAGRPLYCLSPLILNWIGVPTGNRYFHHVAARCEETPSPQLIPAEAVIQNQLFSNKPL